MVLQRVHAVSNRHGTNPRRRAPHQAGRGNGKSSKTKRDVRPPALVRTFSETQFACGIVSRRQRRAPSRENLPVDGNAPSVDLLGATNSHFHPKIPYRQMVPRTLHDDRIRIEPRGNQLVAQAVRRVSAPMPEQRIAMPRVAIQRPHIELPRVIPRLLDPAQRAVHTRCSAPR